MTALSTVLSQRAAAAVASVERTLRGARPGAAARRMSHLMRPAREAVVVITWDKDGYPLKNYVRLSRLGLAGHLVQEAREAREAEARAARLAQAGEGAGGAS